MYLGNQQRICAIQEKNMPKLPQILNAVETRTNKELGNASTIRITYALLSHYLNFAVSQE